MTTKHIESVERKGVRENEVKALLLELNQKVDYLIEMIREDELSYPYHQSFLDIYQQQEKPWSQTDFQDFIQANISGWNLFPPRAAWKMEFFTPTTYFIQNREDDPIRMVDVQALLMIYFLENFA